MKLGTKQSLLNTPCHRAYPQNKLKVIFQDSECKHILINSSPDVGNMNILAKFGQIPSICSQDI